MLYILLLAIIGIVVYVYWDENNNWVAIYSAAGEEVTLAKDRYKFLKDKGIKCKITTNSSFNNLAIGSQSHKRAGVIVLVRKGEEVEAGKWLSYYERMSNVS